MKSTLEQYSAEFLCSKYISCAWNSMFHRNAIVSSRDILQTLGIEIANSFFYYECCLFQKTCIAKYQQYSYVYPRRTECEIYLTGIFPLNGTAFLVECTI